jgi:DNA-binding IclR family transcriptional regulator
MTSNNTPGGVKSDETLLTIIETVRERNGDTISALASDLDMAKSTIHSHLKTLEQHGFVYKEGGEYTIGYRFLDYGIWARNQMDLFQVAKPRLQELADETGYKVWCVIERQGKAVYLYGVEGESPIKTYAREGGTTELHYLAAGKAILAHLPEAKRESIIGVDTLPNKTSSTITDPDELRDELEAVRERGAAYNIGEALEGLNAVGAPITRVEEGVHGAISLSGPANHLTTQELQDKYVERVLKKRNEIEINMRHI